MIVLPNKELRPRTEEAFMGFNRMTGHTEDPLLDSLVADLANAAYPVALRHGQESSWIDLELNLWKALAQTIQKWRPVLQGAVKIIPEPGALGAAGPSPI